ncbi:probable cytochrome P450 6a14 [Copidosoma floridanum]|uniref:probable cytochrome P450 6a14 n=1 Tax=Copidosoma floridanum TaxID=29053 RepID=UPI0006C94D37|nr:probable cytochrome P450 6a14 [Copidosoma floridanum]
MREHWFFGLHLFNEPLIVINDPELVKLVPIKNFSSFRDLGSYNNEHKDPLSANLARLCGDKWRSLRTKLSPAFTSGKLKQMYPLLEEISRELVRAVDDSLSTSDLVGMKDLVSRFTIDCISSIAFGLNCNSLGRGEDEQEVYRHGKMSNDFGKMFVLLTFYVPSLVKFCPVPPAKRKEVHNKMVARRRTENLARKDVLDMLVQLMDQGRIELDDEESCTRDADFKQKETLRKQPGAALLNRVCAEDFDIPGSNYRVPRGMMLVIPINGLHSDPEKFDPTRFTPENTANRHNFTYLPFGEGPRICIGKRLGILKPKIALCYLLREFRFSPSKYTRTPLTYMNNFFIQVPSGGVYSKVEIRRHRSRCARIIISYTCNIGSGGGHRTGPVVRIQAPMPTAHGNGGFECCFVRFCTCVHVEFIKSLPGVFKGLETLLSGMIQSLLINYGLRYSATIGTAFEGSLTTSSACFFTSAMLLVCYIVSEKSYRLIRASLFEMMFNALACFLYLTSAAYLAIATKLFLWPIYSFTAGFDVYPAMTAAYTLSCAAGLLHGVDAYYCLSEFRGQR